MSYHKINWEVPPIDRISSTGKLVNSQSKWLNDPGVQPGSSHLRSTLNIILQEKPLMHMLAPTILLFGLNVLDALLTIVWVRNGVATEGNQLMAGLLDIGNGPFLLVK